MRPADQRRPGLSRATPARKTHARTDPPHRPVQRRHLNQEQRRELIQAELRDRPHVSDRQIAKGLGVSDKTVGTVRKDLEAGAEIPHLTTATGKDAKRALGHGHWLAMFQNKEVPFSLNTAYRLKQVGRDERIFAHVQKLPPSWGTLVELTKLDDAT